MKLQMLAATAALALTIVGCARTGTNTGRAEILAPPSAEPVCMMRGPLPSAIKHKVLGRVESGTQWYGSTNPIVTNMANEGRRIGADAIVGIQTGHSIGFVAWARPWGMGTAVKLENRADFNCVALGGEFR